jgi:hypothetical protein
MSKYGMTPADYRTKWGLPKDYPTVEVLLLESGDHINRLADMIGKIGLSGRGLGFRHVEPQLAGTSAELSGGTVGSA